MQKSNNQERLAQQKESGFMNAKGFIALPVVETGKTKKKCCKKYKKGKRCKKCPNR